jgi:undecaprenyl-diphosphatase
MGPVFEVIALGILQGVTEFLPISSDGHLALAQMLFSMHEPSLTFTVTLHAGTLLATAVALRRRLGEILYELVRSVPQPSRLTQTSAGRDALFVIVASVPTGIIGFFSRDAVERFTASPLAVAVGFFITAAMLTSVRFTRTGLESDPPLRVALVAGVLQGIAVLPGVSRSGSTITAALWLGVRPDRAFELSMLMSLPAVAGALALELPRALAADEALVTVVLGPLVAFVVGLAALRLLRYTVVRGYFAFFALWVFPLAIATLALAWAWPPARV